MKNKEFLLPAGPLVGEIKQLIDQSRQQVAVAVNATMSMIYWQVGKRINEEILKAQRAEFDREIFAIL